MNKATAMTKVAKRNHWANHIKQWLASGKTQRNYCEQHQLKLHQLVYWRRVLTSQHKAKPHSGKAGGFVSVQLTQSVELPTQPLIIQLPNGISIKGIHAGNLELVQKIIRRQS